MGGVCKNGSSVFACPIFENMLDEELPEANFGSDGMTFHSCPQADCPGTAASREFLEFLDRRPPA